MSEFDGPVLLLMWLISLPIVIICMAALFGSGRVAASILIFNAVVLFVFCGLWYAGYYFSDHWKRIIDLGAPWSWLGGLAAVSYAASFLLLRKQSKAVAKSLFGPVITLPAFWFWLLFCALMFDPFA